MGKPSLSQEAKASTKAIIYQMCVAVQKCYEMVEGQIVLIEELGDVTIEDEEQVEVKHYTDTLADNHPNLWKTIYNWLNDDFNHFPYKYLILYTTQQFGSQSTISEWNEKKVVDRLDLLYKIKDQLEVRFNKTIENTLDDKSVPSPSKVLQYQRYILDPIRKDKLEDILQKFYIEAASPTLPKLYKEIQQKYIKGILDGKRDDFLNSLIGFITKPHVDNMSRWEISYDYFDNKVGELITLFSRETRVFPRKYLNNVHVNDQDVSHYHAYSFVIKIQNIEYSDVILEAVNDYLGTIKTIRDEFQNYEVPVSRTDDYVNEIVKIFRGKYRIALNNCSNVIFDSHNFYDEMITSQPVSFEGFDTTPSGFRNGLIHIELNDKHSNLKWRLETDE